MEIATITAGIIALIWIIVSEARINTLIKRNAVKNAKINSLQYEINTIKNIQKVIDPIDIRLSGIEKEVELTKDESINEKDNIKLPESDSLFAKPPM